MTSTRTVEHVLVWPRMSGNENGPWPIMTHNLPPGLHVHIAPLEGVSFTYFLILSPSITQIQVSGQQFQERPDCPLPPQLPPPAPPKHTDTLLNCMGKSFQWVHSKSCPGQMAPNNPSWVLLMMKNWALLLLTFVLKLNPATLRRKSISSCSLSYRQSEDIRPSYDFKWTIHSFLTHSWPQNSLSASNNPRTTWRSQFD